MKQLKEFFILEVLSVAGLIGKKAFTHYPTKDEVASFINETANFYKIFNVEEVHAKIDKLFKLV